MNKNNIYTKIKMKKQLFLLLLITLVVIGFLIDLSTGAAGLSIPQVVQSLLRFGSTESQQDIIVNTIRLPIATMAILVGACLGIAGMEMQTILNNPLASPYTLGISSAATFGASISLIFGNVFKLSIIQNFTTPVFAFVFSLGATLLVYATSRIKQEKGTIILAGIAIGFLFSSLNSMLTFFVSDEVLRGLNNWAQGSILGGTWQQNALIFIVAILVIPLLFRDSWKLTLLNMGDETASSLGVDVNRLRTRILIMTSLITAVAVCFVGTIGFVGLVAPYLAKSLVGEDQRFFIPASILCGAIMLSVSNILSKNIINGGQIPLGIVTSLIGIPFLLLLIFRKGR